jgi:hypothetical protein
LRAKGRPVPLLHGHRPTRERQAGGGSLTGPAHRASVAQAGQIVEHVEEGMDLVGRRQVAVLTVGDVGYVA